MSKTIQLRNVPDSLHRRLAARAATEGMSLSAYLLAEVKRAAERPSLSELRARLAKRTTVTPRKASARAVGESREERAR